MIATLLEFIYWIIFQGRKEPLFTSFAVGKIVTNRTFNIGKAKTRLGYRPINNVKEGVARGVKWAKENDFGFMGKGKKNK